MGEDFSLDNVITGDEAAALFNLESPGNNEEKDSEVKENDSEENNKNDTEDVNVNNLFTDNPESVGNKEIKGKEDTSDAEETSPNFYSSIAKAFAEDGVFQDLNDETISKIKDADSFKELIEQKIQSELDNRQKRIDNALNYGIELSEIQKYEKNLNILNNISEDSLSEEGEQAELLRKNLIYEDYIQRGFSKERATKAVERAIADGTDIEDAKEALQSCKDQVNKSYEAALSSAKKEKEAQEKAIKEQAESLKNSILSEKKVFGEVELDKDTRKKVFDAITKPIYVDPDTGAKLTAIQKYGRDNPNDFIKYLGMTYVLTDGFKSFGKLMQGSIKKGINKGIKELENTLNGTARASDGNLRFVSGTSDPNTSYRKFTLDI